MKYTVDMVSGAIIYTPNFINIGSGIQKLINWNSQTHRKTACTSYKPIFIFSK
jgi:hypothetical protein